MKISLPDAIKALNQGQVVAIPTETVYGLAARYDQPLAIHQVFELKSRPKDHPLIVHISDLTQLAELAEITPVVNQLARAFWPGPLTLVLNKKSCVDTMITAGQPSVAVRMPAHPMALEVIRETGPLVAPSANRFTQLSPTSAEAVEAALGESISVLDGGACKVGIESTIVSLLEPHVLSILRPGMISLAELTQATGLRCHESWRGKSDIKVPGRHALHYSPRKPLKVFLPQQIEQYHQYLAQSVGVQAINLPADPAACANRLYALLRSADEGEAKSLCVLLPPDEPVWSGIRDRLLKAGHLGNQ